MSWSLDFIREWFAEVDLRSALRLRRYVLNGETADHDLTVNLRRWGPIQLRGLGGGDYRMMYDTFCGGRAPLAPQSCKTVIDLGGNVGFATISLARTHPNLHAFVVEPDPGNVEALKTNLAPMIDAGRCRVRQAALWRTNEMVDVAPPPLPGSFGAIQVCEAQNGNGLVQGMTMDALIDHSGFNQVDLLKVDVEGAEAGMFAAGTDWLGRVRSIAIEFHGDARRASDFDRVVKAHGMTVTDVGADGAFAEANPEQRSEQRQFAYASET